MRILAIIFAALSIMLFAGCRTVAVIPVGTHVTATHSQHIYPPHAPSHGYRHHYHDHDLVYDTDFGAYLVLGYDGIYFYNNLYLRFYSGAWQTSSRLNGSWLDAEHHHVPDRLRGHKRYKKHHRHSPPPHAPAHGHRYRNHQHGVDMVFDSRIGAYIVLGFDDLFYFNNNYMRFYDGYWHHSDRHNGRWRRANDRHVPHKLKKARRHNNKGFFNKIKKQYKKEHREYRERHDHNKKGGYDKRRKDRHERRDDRRDRHDGGKDKRDRHDGHKGKKDRHDDSNDKKGNRRKKDHDDDDDNDRREKRSSGWLR